MTAVSGLGADASASTAAPAPAPQSTRDPRGFEPPERIPPAEQLGRIHFVGVGGVGMAPVARIAVERGLPVSGSDIKRSAAIDALAADGAVVSLSQGPENLDGVDTVVVSTGVRADNVEIAEAQRRGLPIIHRATALAALMVGRRAVLVAGTHGKTTTTSMAAVALGALGLDPSYAIGGEIGASGLSGHSGAGDVFVAEADESDGTFRHYQPDVAVVTNVELDHPDYFASVEHVRESFIEFTRRIKPGGALIACADDPGSLAVGRAAEKDGARVVWYGEAEWADVRYSNVELERGHASFTVCCADDKRADDKRADDKRADAEPAETKDADTKDKPAEYRLTLGIPGAYNAANATACFAVLRELGVGPTLIPAAIAEYRGARRRMELKGEAGGVRVYDDYMHHPTEITATLAAFRALAGEGQLIVAFQPQRYTRAQAFLREYGPPLGAADAVVVLEVYPGSGEDPIPGVTGAVVAADVPLPADRVVFEPDTSAVAARLAHWARPGDLVVTAGAGDVTRLGPEVLKLLGAGEARQPGRDGRTGPGS